MQASSAQQTKGDGKQMRSKASIFGSSMIAMGALVLCGLPLNAQDNPAPVAGQAVRFAVSAPLSELAKLPQRPIYGVHEANPVRRIPKRNFGKSVDPVEQSANLRSGSNYSIGLNLLGVGNGFPNYSVPDAPPDTNLAVGDTQVVQWVNVSFAIFNKTTGAVEAGPIEGNTLYSGLGGACAASNAGDIIAQWDVVAHRWLLTQNVFSGPPYYACVAISKTPDAMGSYYLYQFSLGNGFPDYPKWGQWNVSWAETMNNFGPGGSGFVGPEVCVYDRNKLIAGDPTAGQVCFQLASDGDSLLPADRDSVTNPPSTEDQFFIGSVGDVDNSHLSLYSVHIDWSNPSGATITGNHNSQLIAVPTYTGSCGGAFGGACVPQKGISDRADSLGDRLMYRFAYYNEPFPVTPPTSPLNTPHQHWYVNGDVEASGGQIGVRWYEFRALQNRVPVTGINLFQSGTYAPDSNFRWMGSLTQDKNNDILAGYSISSSSVYPSIAIAGRTTSDALGTLEPEVMVVAGSGSQPDTSNRWGDYSSMRIDQDGCTFWYTTEFYQVTQTFDWSTQLASAKFANCH
jgi:hypothetical protein